MPCKFKWYNLPTQINKIIKPYTDTKVLWYNIPVTLTKVYKQLALLKPTCKVDTNFIWYTLNQKANAICTLVDCLNTNTQRMFDVTSSNWDTLQTQSDWENYFASQGAITRTITNFSNVANRIQFDMVLDLANLILTGLNITTVRSINIANLTQINLGTNQIVAFNPVAPLPSTLQNLALDNNLMISFAPTIALPISLQTIDLNTNKMTTVGYASSQAWASSLTVISGRAIYLANNINSASGTNLKTILESKGFTVSV